MHDNDGEADGKPVVSSRTMDILVALALIVGSAVVIFDSVRSGFGWRDDGPAPGFFPFWVATLLGVASVVNLIKAVGDREAADEAFVRAPQLRRVLAVLVPTTLYVAAIGGVKIGPVSLPGLGIYVASALFIAGFMWMLREAVGQSLAGRAAGAVGVMLAAGVLTAALLWVMARGFVPIPWVELPYALVLALVIVSLPLGEAARCVTLGPAVAIAIYSLFEIWFKVPLVKGPIEALLGIG